MYFDVLLKVIGGLGLFLYGMDKMSTGMQQIAGQRLKKILGALTTNRIMAILVGIFVTALVQSSSVSTVMTIGFVNAMLLNLKQAVGIILGANIGTTITGWILVLKIGKYGLPMAGAAAMACMFLKGEKAKIKALTVMGLGLIFFGLELMSDGLKPLRSLPEFVSLFHAFQADSYFGIMKAAAVGALLTAVVQSSSATLGITITLALQGLIDYPTAVALVLGENVGTTITAWLASLNANANAKRAAYAHILINVIGVIWVTTIFWGYLAFLRKIVNPEMNITKAIATAHTIFNVTNVILFIPFIGVLAKFLGYIVKDDDLRHERVTHLDPLMVETPSVIIDQTKEEILAMGGNIETVFNMLDDALRRPEAVETISDDIQKIEDKLDIYQKEITDVNFKILNKPLNEEYVEKTRRHLQACDEYETISDYQLRIVKTLKKLQDNDILLNERKLKALEELNAKLKEVFADIDAAIETGNRDQFTAAIKKCLTIKEFYKQVRSEHVEHVGENENLPTMLSTGYMDILNYYRRIRDHIYNIIEVYANI